MEVEGGGRQSEVLLEPLREVLAHGVGAEMELVMVGTGPGSYNGARVGIAAGQGVAIVRRCPAVGVCSLEALAPVRTGDWCVALGDARRGSFFTLELRGGKMSGLPELMPHAQFAAAVERALTGGARLVALEDPGRLKLGEELSRKVEHAAPSAALLLEAWAAKSEGEREALCRVPPEPFYLRSPYIRAS